MKFPKLHLATSVTNRILNIWDEVEPPREPPVPSIPPPVPDPSAEGEVLDTALTGVPDTAPTGATAPVANTPAGQAVVSEALQGNGAVSDLLFNRNS